jgi:hypothetical protein
MKSTAMAEPCIGRTWEREASRCVLYKILKNEWVNWDRGHLGRGVGESRRRLLTRKHMLRDVRRRISNLEGNCTTLTNKSSKRPSGLSLIAISV